MNAGNALANRLNTYTDRHVQSTNPTHPAPPSNEVISGAAIANARTAGLAERAEAAAKQFGNAVHEGGKKLGAQLPDSIVKPASAAPTPEADKGELRKVAEEGWNQLTIAAKGLASAAGTVAGSVSGSAHKAVEHNFGKQADKVAQGESGPCGSPKGQPAALTARYRSDRCERRLDCSVGRSRDQRHCPGRERLVRRCSRQGGAEHGVSRERRRSGVVAFRSDM